jgi:hypothetical protein
LTVASGYYILLLNRDALLNNEKMIDVGIGFSSLKNSVSAAEEAFARALSTKQDRGKIDLVFVFSSPEFLIPNLSKTITSLDGIPVIGSTAAAIISNQGVFKHGFLLMLLSFPKGVYFTSACAQELKEKEPLAVGLELGEKLRYGFKNLNRNFCLLFFDRMLKNGEALISGIQEHLGRSFPCLGTFASDNPDSPENYLYFNQGILSNSCAAIAWAGKLSFGLGLKHGWKPLGKPHTITSASGNTVRTIDGEPAVKLYEEYLALALPRLKKEIKRLSVFYPIGVYLPEQKEYLLRTILNVQEDGSLLCQGNIPEASTIRLMIRTKETCLEATSQAAEEAKKGLSNQIIKYNKEKSSKVAIIFNSIARASLLRRDLKKEVETLQENLGPDIPMIGIYTCGELAPLMMGGYRGRSHLHNQTISVLIIEG